MVAWWRPLCQVHFSAMSRRSRHLSLSIAPVISALTVLHACGEQPRNLSEGLYAEVETRHGDIVVQLEFERATLTVANFVGLAEGTISYSGGGGPFYDGLTFHRVVDNFMIQGGDPQGDGRGGPGYRFVDEIVPELRHDRAGILSMANAGPDSNGSQFFITHGPTPHLDGRHAVFGHVVAGQEVVDAVVQGDRIQRVRIIRVGQAAEGFQPNQAAFERLQEEIRVARNLQQEALIEAVVPGAQRTASGLRYLITKSGTGASSPSASSTVTVHYVGKFLDGTVFDSSHSRNEPAEFEVGRVIPGFSKSLQAMVAGEQRTVVIPPELGYGDSTQGPIPPGSYLVFEIELIAFSPAGGGQ